MPKNKHLYIGSILKVCSLFCFMLVVCINNAFAQKPTLTITHKGNVFEMQSMADTVIVLDPITTEISTIIQNPNPVPVKLNNMNIYAEGDVDTEPSLTWAKLVRYIVQSSNKQVSALGNGEYKLIISNVILNEQGKIVYYNFDGINKQQGREVIASTDNNNINATVNGSTNNVGVKLEWVKIDERTNRSFAMQIEYLMNKAPAYQPAKVQGSAVPYRLPASDIFKSTFYIKNGAIYYN